MVGPRMGYRADRVRVFAQALFGGVSFNPGNNDFGMIFGGGVDMPLNKHISMRVVEFDWLTARNTVGLTTNWKNQLRFSSGIVFKFGSKK